MIQANELRIGNYILDDEGIIVKVEKVESPEFYEWNGMDDEPVIFSINGSMMMSPIIKGIPLTEEILLKCGFVNANIRFKPRNSHWRKGNISLWCDNKGNYAFQSQNHTTFIKYLHQLQNLYFALTNNEIKINLHSK